VRGEGDKTMLKVRDMDESETLDVNPTVKTRVTIKGEIRIQI
jgi:hypothetical protein